MHELLPYFESFEQDRVEATDARAVRRDDISGKNNSGAPGASNLRTGGGELDLNAGAQSGAARQTKLARDAA